MTRAVDFLRVLPISGKGLALLGSISVHAALALAAVRGAPHAARDAKLPANAIVEVAALELALTEAPMQPVPIVAPPSAPTLPRHHHDYPVPPDHDVAAHDPAVRHALPWQGAPNLPPAPAPATADESRAETAPRFVMTVAPTTRVPGGTGAETSIAQARGESAPAPPAAEASVDTPAKLLTGSWPSYTREAEAAGVEADVPLEIVVDSVGSVTSARALSHVGYGLDDAALRSVRGYRFSPARRGAKALAVRMRWLMRFQLR